MSFNTSLSGINAANSDLNVTANNIANVNTTGFKESRAEFADLFSYTTYGLSRNAIGAGVKVSNVAQQFSQGNIDPTGRSLDFAIDGEGFFTVNKNGNTLYTRAGNFQTDNQGYVVTPDGARLQVFAPNAGGAGFDVGRLSDLQLLTTDSPPAQTGMVNLMVTLPGNASPPVTTPFDPADPNSYNASSGGVTVYLAGVATGTADLLAAARRGNPQVAVACTRKNFPGTKAAAMKAILCGGALPHRLGLSETLLLFAEHRLFLGDETAAQTVARLRQQCPERKLVVEVSSGAEAEVWAAAGADVLQLEKLPPAEVAAVVQMSLRHPQRPVVAVAGGVSLANAEAYAATGAQVLVSSSPYQSPPKDVQVTFALV